MEALNKGYTEVGHTLKKHGVQGEIKWVVEDKYVDYVEEIDIIYFENQEDFFPYKITSLRSSNPFILKLEGLDTPESLKSISFATVFVKSEVFEDLEEEEVLDLIDFEVNDELLGYIGKVESTEEYPMQTMLKVTHEAREIIIPLTEAFIVDIDPENKVIHLDLPQGLLEINK